MTWFVYILICSDNSYYVGITNDLEKRVVLHNSGQGSKYLLSKLPADSFILKYIQINPQLGKEKYN